MTRRAPKPAIKETDLFPPVKEWLESQEFTVYSEVMEKSSHSRADVVGIRGPLLVVVELKTTLSLDLIEQAVNWIGKAHYIWVATPQTKSPQRMAERILRHYGIGQVDVEYALVSYQPMKYGWVAREGYIRPKLHRRITNELRDAITEEHKDGLPGGHQGGGYVTNYSQTIGRVKRHLQHLRKSTRAHQTPGGWATVKEILDHVETHYMQPRQGLYKALTTLETDWCESRRVGRETEFRYKDGAKT